MSSALDRQVGGDHYKSQAIQPVQFIEGGALRFLKACIVKRLCRYDKPTGKGLEDLEKSLHELELSELYYPPIDIEEFVEANKLSAMQALAIAAVILGRNEEAKAAIEELKARFLVDNSMEKMLHGIYSDEKGPDKRLWFKGALLRRDPNNPDNYLAQFDPLCLPEAFGWASYPKDYFVNLT